MEQDLSSVKYVGTATAARLAEHGITTLEQLAAMPLDDLVAIPGIGEHTAPLIHASAQDVLADTTVDVTEVVDIEVVIPAEIVSAEELLEADDVQEAAAEVVELPEKSAKKQKKLEKQVKKAEKKAAKKAKKLEKEAKKAARKTEKKAEKKAKKASKKAKQQTT
jgi:transcription termination factor NusA